MPRSVEDYRQELSRALALLENMREDVARFDSSGWREELLLMTEAYRKATRTYGTCRRNQTALWKRVTTMTRVVDELVQRLEIGDVLLGTSGDLQGLEANLKRHKAKLRMQKLRSKRRTSQPFKGKLPEQYGTM